MTIALILLHASPEAENFRAHTAVRLAGAMLADGKDVTMFLVEEGLHLIHPAGADDNPARQLFIELLEAGMAVQVCGASLRKLGWNESDLPAGVAKSSMKTLSALLSQADEVVSI